MTIGGCRDCHTPQNNGQLIKALDLAGGFSLRGPWGEVATANITPAPSGIPYYDERLFMDTIRTGFVKRESCHRSCPGGCTAA